MSADDVTQIKIGKHRTGVIGLQQTLTEIAREFIDRPDDQVEAELLRRLSVRNYIPAAAKEAYGRAFLNAYKKFSGQAIAEDESGSLEIKILGPGCARCDRLEADVLAVMSELDIVGDIEHVRDINAIGQYGVMGTPALIINGDVKAVGSVPTKTQLKTWLLAVNQNQI